MCFYVTCLSPFSLSLSLSLSHSHIYHSTLLLAAGSASITNDISLVTVSNANQMLNTNLTAELQFVPMGGSMLCLDFNITDDAFIETTESFQGTLQPTMPEFDRVLNYMIIVYITDNDGKLGSAYCTSMNYKVLGICSGRFTKGCRSSAYRLPWIPPQLSQYSLHSVP